MPGRTEWHDGRKMAAELIQRHPDVFKDVPPLSDILFVLDEENAPKSKGNYVMARVSKIAGKVVDFIDAGNKLFMLEWFTANVGNMTRNKRYLLLAHELQHFEYDEDKGEHKLRGHDVEEFYLIADRFGLHWADSTHGDVDDITAPGFRWGRQGQARLDLAGTAAELVGTFGLEGAKAVVAAVKESKAEGGAQISGAPNAKPDDWQPPDPYVTKDKVINLADHRPTGTSGTEN